MRWADILAEKIGSEFMIRIDYGSAQSMHQGKLLSVTPELLVLHARVTLPPSKLPTSCVLYLDTSRVIEALEIETAAPPVVEFSNRPPVGLVK